METLANLESFVRSAEEGSFSGAGSPHGHDAGCDQRNPVAVLPAGGGQVGCVDGDGGVYVYRYARR